MDPTPTLSEASTIAQREDSPASANLPKVRQAADLVITHDALGQYLSFYWRGASHIGLDIETLVNTQMSPTSGPVELDRYLSKVRWVLGHLKPTQFRATFCYRDQYFEFDLTLSPIFLRHQTVRTLLVLGKSVSPLFASLQTSYQQNTRQALVTEVNLARYHRLFTQIAWNIRRTLDLETIWQQAVNGLGNVLNVERCFICSYEPGCEELPIVAEYQRVPSRSLRGNAFNLKAYPKLRQALENLTPVTVMVSEHAASPQENRPSILQPSDQDVDCGCTLLAMATSYQDIPNGLIVMGCGYCIPELLQSTLPGLESPDPLEALPWSPEQIDLVGELADQVGTAIAHAKVFTASQALTKELQAANNNLVEKHWEVEEARQQAEEASRLKSEFLANTSHELRTPLNGMIGFLKLVLDGLADSPEEERDFIMEAHRSALLLLDIINDILDVAKIEAGKMDVSLNPVNFNELLADIEKKTRTHAEHKNLDYQIIPPATRDEVIVYGDYQRLLQVMLNVIGNAIKFTHEGSVTVKTQIRKQRVVVQDQELPGYLAVSIADTGIGVSLENQLRLFHAFSQVDSSRTRQFGGTGLGLLISQRLVEAMGGTVQFFSLGEGLGSTVTFTVPLFQLPVITSES